MASNKNNNDNDNKQQQQQHHHHQHHQQQDQTTRRTSRPTILVTGGAGYVGSHSVLLLLEQDYRVIVIDNCSNAYQDETIDDNGNLQILPESLRRVQELANKSLELFSKLDLVSDVKELETIFHRYHPIEAVIHFAALKSVSESINLPLEYYSNNLIGTINLLNVMRQNNCFNLIFSSSATVYGLPQYLPVDEKHQTGLNILNPYGRTKFMIECILKDLCVSKEPIAQQQVSSINGGHVNGNGTIPQPTNNNNNGNIVVRNKAWNIIALRYFNPVGAHPSGYIGEHTQGVPNNLMPYVSQVSIGKRDKLFVFGNDFDTIDGTGVRDYIHIMDLARGHTKALEHLLASSSSSPPSSSSTVLNGSGIETRNKLKVYNLGTGKGYSVLEVIKTFERINNVTIPYEIVGRREGDAGSVYADAELAKRELNWSAIYSIIEMCRDTYKWQSNHPDGFKTSSTKHENGDNQVRCSTGKTYTILQAKNQPNSNTETTVASIPSI